MVPETEPSRVLRLKATARLAKMLASMRPAARAAWRSSTEVPVLPNAGNFLRILRSLWTRYRLARFTTPTPREEWLLRGQLTTANLPNDERLALAGLVDVGTLNSLAGTSEATRESIGEFSRRLAELVPPSDVRAALWSAMLAGVSEIELRDEIRSSAPGLRAVVENALAERAWTAPRSTDLRLQLATVPMLLLPTYCRRSKATLIHCSVSRVVRSVSSSDAVEGVPETETPAPPVVVDAPEQVSSGPPIAPGVEPIPGTFTTMVWTPPGSDAA